MYTIRMCTETCLRQALTRASALCGYVAPKSCHRQALTRTLALIREARGDFVPDAPRNRTSLMRPTTQISAQLWLHPRDFSIVCFIETCPCFNAFFQAHDNGVDSIGSTHDEIKVGPHGIRTSSSMIATTEWQLHFAPA